MKLKNKGLKKIEIMDTTLRDGEQTPGVSFTVDEKFTVAKMLLEEVKVDRIEVGSACVSKGEMDAVKKIVNWGKTRNYLEKIEVLGFVDGMRSVDWLVGTGAKVLNLLCKGSARHVENQLKKSCEEHLADINFVLAYAQKNDLKVNVYLEDWSNGIVSSPDYVFELIESLKGKVERFMLADTLGILNPEQAYRYFKVMLAKYPDGHFDFHGHNDYDLVIANVYMAAKAGIKGVHTTVNGLGERAGNAPFSSVIGVLKDHHQELFLAVDETKLNKISRIVEAFSGVRVPANKPIVGEHVFTQTCGIHADGDSKGDLYHNALLPERFGRLRKYALGKTSGKASIVKNLAELGIELEQEAIEKITEKVVELGDKKDHITTEDLPYIISDVLGSKLISENIKIKNYYICHAKELSPVATLCLDIHGDIFEETAIGAGQYDAFMKALQKIYQRLNKSLPALVDYVVTIPPGGDTSALVETVITWKSHKEFKTRGLDSDQTGAAIKATVKMLNLMENGFRE
ncbi:MAG TPA: 2-isopropylmalate synthase [Clostridia bacterium]|nr:2-isopropylmalate synthase [Clostridia bacterium]